MGNQSKDEALYQEMCRVVGKVVLEMRDLGQEPKAYCDCGSAANVTGKSENETYGAHPRGDGTRRHRTGGAVISGNHKSAAPL